MSKTVSLKAPLSKIIQARYTKLNDTIGKVTPEDFVLPLLNGTGGKVSVADLIAQQIGWGNLLISWYRNGVDRKKFVMPGEGFETWDYTGIAKHFHKKYHYNTIEEAQEELHHVATKIITIVEHEYTSGHLESYGIWKWCTLQSGKQWPLSQWIITNTAAPYQRVQKQIRDFIQSRK